MYTIPTLICVIILGFEGVASLLKWHSGFAKFLRRLRDCIYCGGSGMDQEEDHSTLQELERLTFWEPSINV